MNLKPKPQSTEIDHIRDTLTDVIDGLGQTRGEMHQRFDQQNQRFDRVEQRVDQQGKELNEFKLETRKRFDKIEDTLAIIVNHLKK